MPSKIINERLKKRKLSNKYDKIDLNFHNQVSKGYKILSKNNSRFYSIDATDSIENIHREIVKILRNIK